MDTLGVTMDVYDAAIDGLNAVKESLVARKEGSFTAKCVSIGRMEGHYAVKKRAFEDREGSFTVIDVYDAAIRGHNDAKRESFALMRVHEAAMEGSNLAI